ncbi:MAG TPA: dihydroxyacetone kinase transcriptional activator DhaS [Caproiciproducens sp.]|nr:dihydroxyacetone kinase transcriptional activator DhaS [Caproiciproducens sp.]
MSDSLITKRAIAASVKELMKKKGLEKISVSEIVENCGINRQTFYYHFKDKYDLIDWIYYNEVVSVVTQNKLHENWSDVVRDVLRSMKQEQYFYTNALNVTGQNSFQDYLFEVTKGLVMEILDEIADDSKIENRDKEFIAAFNAYGLVGITVRWARSGMKEQPDEIVLRLSHLIQDSFRSAAARYFKEQS